MSQHFTLTDENYEAVKALAVASLRAGDVVCMAMEGGYVYAAYAFDQNAISTIHRMREAQPGTQAQILVGEISTVLGIATNFSGELEKLASKFWPGPLTLLLSPQRGLAWDLGDGGELEHFAVRMPSRKFIHDVISATGPVAVASASVSGMPPMTNINFVQGEEVALFIDEGEIQENLTSSIVEKREDGLHLIREGSLSRETLAEIAPILASS